MKRISQVIDELISKSPNLSGLKLFALRAAWKEAVGDLIAEKATIKGLKNGVLEVVCKDPMWRMELSLMKEKIIAKLNEAAGSDVVRDLKISQR